MNIFFITQLKLHLTKTEKYLSDASLPGHFFTPVLQNFLLPDFKIRYLSYKKLMLYNRRLWLQQSLTALAATAFSRNIIARTTPAFSPLAGTILLNSNENPYGPSPMARKAILQHYLTSNRYPDDYILLLKKR
jgi:hypothetical protein